MKKIKSDHRINSATLVNRRLVLVDVTGKNRITITDAVSGLIGMDEVSLYQNDNLQLKYDATRIALDDIETVLKTLSVSFSKSWWNRTKLSWYKFIDGNVKSNFHHIPHCCNKPPLGKQ